MPIITAKGSDSLWNQFLKAVSNAGRNVTTGSLSVSHCRNQLARRVEVIERLLEVGREIAWITPIGLCGQREHALRRLQNVFVSVIDHAATVAKVDEILRVSPSRDNEASR